MKKNILVFPCGSEIGLEVYKSVSLSIHFNLIGGSSVADHGKFVYENYIEGLPNVDSIDFVDALNKVIEDNNIDFIFPAHDSVVLKLATEAKKGRIKCGVITSSAETCQITRSKGKTYERLKDVIKTPKLFESVQSVSVSDFPIFLKPDVGQGSKGVHKANSVDEAIFYVKSDPTLLVMEYLPGKEYTIDCFTDNSGELIFCEGRERARILNGISMNSVCVEDRRFQEIAKKINHELSFNGVWFFQVKEDNEGDLVLLEIAPRVAGTMALARGKGVNLALMSLFNAAGQNVSVVKNRYNLEIDRALENRYRHDIKYSHVFIDFDDLVVFDGQVNTQVVSFLFECVNSGKKIHLLTRHTGDIHAALRRYRIGNLFDEVIVVKNGAKKSTYINEQESIFIDDSFAERKEVSENKGIPVFDGHMLESLRT